MKPENALIRTEWTVADCPLSLAREMVEEYHYARGGSNTRVFCHGLYHVSDPSTLMGVAWWIPPTKGAALTVSEDWKSVLSLTRLVVHPSAPTNAASFLLGRSIRMIRQDGRWKTLLTYADEGQGHTGGIYLASNWEYVGKRPGEPVWIDPRTGRHVAKKAGPKTRRATEMMNLGYVMVGRTDKHKFIFRLDPPKNTRKDEKDQKDVFRQPYSGETLFT